MATPGARRDPLRIALELGLYVFLYVVMAFVTGPILYWLGGYLFGITATGLTAAVFTNWLSLRIFDGLPVPDIGLRWQQASWHNLWLGLVGGAGAVCAVLLPAVAAGAAHFRLDAEPPTSLGSGLFVAMMLLVGATGEEILFRGFGFQILVRGWGPIVIFPVGALFAGLHWMNPHATIVGMLNTAAFGILFGYAFLRSHDLWLPIGLHYGWNFTLSALGANVSGIRIRMTGLALEWTAGARWSGGDYGPEASLLTSVVMVPLLVFLWKASIRRQRSALLDPPPENALCESGPSSLPSR